MENSNFIWNGEENVNILKDIKRHRYKMKKLHNVIVILYEKLNFKYELWLFFLIK